MSSFCVNADWRMLRGKVNAVDLLVVSGLYPLANED